MSRVDEIMALAQEYGIYYSAWDRLPNKGRKSALDEKSQELRNAIEALAQPAGEAEPFEIEWPEYSSEGMGCGLEDRNITNRYEAMAYGWQEAIDSCMRSIPDAIYTTRPLD